MGMVVLMFMINIITSTINMITISDDDGDGGDDGGDVVPVFC